MAKAADVQFEPADSFAAVAALTVRTRAAEMFELAQGVLDTSDIERVHDMRVASRRLRAALEIFAACFPKAEHKDVLRDVKRIADALGARRDPDVHIAAMERFEAAAPAVARPGTALLTRDLRARQERANVELAAALGDMRERGLEDRLDRLAAAALEHAP